MTDAMIPLAERFGTPLYVYDLDAVRGRCRALRLRRMGAQPVDADGRAAVHDRGQGRSLRVHLLVRVRISAEPQSPSKAEGNWQWRFTAGELAGLAGELNKRLENFEVGSEVPS